MTSHYMQYILKQNTIRNVSFTSISKPSHVRSAWAPRFVQLQIHLSPRRPGGHRQIYQYKLNPKERAKVRASRLNFFNNKDRDLSSQTGQPDSTASKSSAPSNSHMDSEPPSKRMKSEAMVAPTKTHLIIRFYDHDIRAKDSHGRKQEDILSWSDTQLERSHNYIQMLFPLPEGSPYNFSAPVITREVFDAFRSRSDLRDGLRKSFERMLEFYGFAVSRESRVGVKSKQEDGKEGDEIENVATHMTSVATAKAIDESPQDTDTITSTETNDTTATASSAPPKTSSPTSYSIIRGPKWRTNSSNWCVRFDHNHLRITRILRCLRVLGLQTECDAFYKALQQVFDDPAVSIGDRSMMYWTRAVQRPLFLAPDDDDCEWLEEWEDEQKNPVAQEEA
ncbi:hypothetical protein T440DRAFT_502103 [Plenodomus tracheiphilus IPT5]|uniref:Opioid growth factor receptor (OGFr) conserved domain-containing protein n=1 Tax=Plenodomus tracheiphilus IPT5 TaxID=1408161 RepID=A0A6A7AUW2_9PLEO|nr:hypothetical protein T440DRAFT_502103 [Plenodomus tracheiphilus IPT5]